MWLKGNTGFVRLSHGPQAGLPSSSALARGGPEANYLVAKPRLKSSARGQSLWEPGGALSQSHLSMEVGCDVRPVTGMHHATPQ